MLVGESSAGTPGSSGAGRGPDTFRGVSQLGRGRRAQQPLGECLLALGLQKGDRLALYAPNCAEYIDFFFGTAKSGVPGAHDTRLSAYELASYHSYVRPRALLVHADLVDQARDGSSRCRPSSTSSASAGTTASTSTSRPCSPGRTVGADVEVDESDIYQLGATSGTTASEGGDPDPPQRDRRDGELAAAMPVPVCGTALQNIPMFSTREDLRACTRC